MNPNIILNITNTRLKLDNYFSKLLIIKYFNKDYLFIKSKNFIIEYKFCWNLSKITNICNFDTTCYELYESDNLTLNDKSFIIPSQIGLLNNLVNFNAGCSQLYNIATEIGLLNNLEIFIIGVNNLKLVPSELGLLKNLKVLHLQHGQLKILPTQLGNLDNLRELLI
jgi:Leucine-rich repeat (LRR) protein